MTDTLLAPAAITTAQPERCPESWRLSEELRRRKARLLSDPRLIEPRAEYEHVASEMVFHHTVCPVCRAYFDSLEGLGVAVEEQEGA